MLHHSSHELISSAFLNRGFLVIGAENVVSELSTQHGEGGDGPRIRGAGSSDGARPPHVFGVYTR